MKDWLKRISPSKSEISNHKHMRVFGDWLHDPNLWHLNRRSVAGAFAVGLFFMYMPPFFQMVQAGFAAIFLRVNLPISTALVWITNPITIPPMYYFAYVLGCWVLAKPPAPFDLDFWLNWHNWLEILAPLSLGSLICAAVCSVTGYLVIEGLWRWNLGRQIRRRKARLQNSLRARNPTPPPEAHPGKPETWLR
jgi:uncharacterized protein (DUF2062 family)